MIENFWEIQVQVFPVVFAMLMLEIPNILRAIFPIPYVPVYFSLYPFNVLNRDLSIYLNEDSFFGDGEDLSEDELKDVKSTIFRKAGLSIIISLGLAPFIGGFLAAFFLPYSSLIGFAVIFIAYKLIGIVRAGLRFGEHSVCNFKSMSLYAMVYAAYFLCFLKLFHKSYTWALPFVEKQNWLGLVNSLFDLFIVEILFSTVLVGTLVAIFLSFVTNRKFRRPHGNQTFDGASE